jgi:Zn-dependent peptidase ImmA (M78 family)
MSRGRREIAQIAVSKAMTVRKQAKCDLHSPLNVFDVCESLGVSVFFQAVPSMEGIYVPDARPRPAIVVSSLRPLGRKAMTCGHELGHHIFKHGRQWDELVEERSQSRRSDPNEFQADLFSACLQMPKTAVCHAMTNRKLNPARCPAEDIFALSTFFGVSYAAFVTHLERTLNLIEMQRASQLIDRKPKEIRQALLGEPCPQNLFVLDFYWKDRAVDAEVGDSLLLPPRIVLEGNSVQLEATTRSHTVARASQPGISRVSHSSGWSTFVRVMRKDYVGRAPFRFDEEVADAD